MEWVLCECAKMESVVSSKKELLLVYDDDDEYDDGGKGWVNSRRHRSNGSVL